MKIGATRSYVCPSPGNLSADPGPQCVSTPCRMPKRPVIRDARDGMHGELDA